MIRAVALVLTVLTGFSGLIYEVTWQKYLATLLGSHSEATAAVLGIFLGGLSVGYALFGRLVRRLFARASAQGAPTRLLVLYGVIEAGIGIWALLFPTLFSGVHALSLQLALDSQGLGFALDVFFTVLLVGPPAVLMGGTIPILTQALSRGLEDATRFHAFVYGFNTTGAFAGALAAAFVLIPALGLDATLAWMGAVNIVAGVLFALLGLRAGPALPPPDAPDAAVPEGFGSYAAAALLLGFGMMSIQTVLIRLGGLALGSSQFTFATVVAVFVLCIAIGSLCVSAFRNIPRAIVVACPATLALLLVLLYFALPDTTYGAYVLRTLFSSEAAAFLPYQAAVFAVVLLVLLVPVGLSGASLPLLFHQLRREVGELGSVAGRLYSWNTVGNLAGALLGGYVLLLWIDLDVVYRLAVASVGLATLLLAVRVLGLSRPLAFVAAVPLLYALTLLPPWPAERLSAGLFRDRTADARTYDGADAYFRGQAGREFVFHTDDPTSTVAVTRRVLAGGIVNHAILVNGKSDGSLVGDYPTMALVALIPCLLAEQCERVFVIGYGTGVTAGEFAALESVERVEVAEISSGVLEAAPFFDYGNLAASEDPKVVTIRSDAYRALLRSDTDYDVIASEPSNPWVVGVEMLFSREFLEAARDRLRPGGVYAQWFHIYETNPATVELVLRTYNEVFDDVAVWYSMGPDLLLLGFRDDPEIELERVAERAGRADFRSGLRRAGVPSLPALLAHELYPLGSVREMELGDDVHTLFHPILSDRAARAFYQGLNVDVPEIGGAREAATRDSLLGAWLAAQEGGPDDAELDSIARQLCRYRPYLCAAFIAWWQRQAPDSPGPEAVRARFRELPGMDPHLAPEQIASLGELYGDGDTAPTNARQVRENADRYARYYFHATPFQRAALRSVGARCRGEQCIEARHDAAQRIGGTRN